MEDNNKTLGFLQDALDEVSKTLNISLRLEGAEDILMQLEEIKGQLNEIYVQLEQVNKFKLGDGIDITQLVISVISMVVDIIGARKTITAEFKKIGTAFKEEGDVIRNVFGNIAGAMSTELTKPIKEELNGMSKTLTKISETIGESISNGIVDGLRGGVKRVREFSQLVCEDGIITEMKETLEIHSPSKVMKRIGGYIAEGLGDGIKDGSKDVERAMKSVTDTVEDSAKKTSKVKFGFGGIAAVAGIVASLVGYFANMMSTNEELSGKMQEVLSTTYTKPRVLDI